VLVEGEVSNLTTPASGHLYFSLKDEHSQIRAVVWKTSARLLRFRPKDGLKVVVRGSIRIYAPRGEYQLSVDWIEPLGKGALQQAYEELKQRLDQEGLFAAERKRPLPVLPRRIGVVTSPSGAVVRDILQVLARRAPGLEVLIYPARVQGEGAAEELVAGIRALANLPGIDVLIVARGGGSLEDLWAFNDERVARALAASAIPTISAVGHETDYTIADFVADLRAPTPSAAAESVSSAQLELALRLHALDKHARGALELRLQRLRGRVQALTAHRVFAAEQGRLRTHAQRVDGLGERLDLGLQRRFESARRALERGSLRLQAFTLERQLRDRRSRLGATLEQLQSRFEARLHQQRARLERGAARLQSLSPLAVLSRGYALAFQADGRLVRSESEVALGARLRLRLHAGTLEVDVRSKETG